MSDSREAQVAKQRPLTGIFDKSKVAEYGEFENTPEASQYRYEDGTNANNRKSHASGQNAAGGGSTDYPADNFAYEEEYNQAEGARGSMASVGSYGSYGSS